jgi:hypothetical protein
MAEWMLVGKPHAPFSQLTSLVDLDLHSNKLYGTLPEMWSCLMQLQMLDVHRNSLQGSIPAAFGALKQLTML